MSGGNQPPFRMPCEGVAGAPRYFLGSAFQHSLAPQLVTKYVNTTTVPDPAGGDPIPPYERYTPSPGGLLNCETHSCDTDPGSAPCSAWLRPYIANDFDADGNVDFAVLRKRGFKNVQAFRRWNGRPGYTDPESVNANDTVTGCGDDTQVRYRSYRTTPNASKYRTLAISSEWVSDYDPPPTAPDPTPLFQDHTFGVTQSIGETSGLWTFSGLSLSPNDNLNNQARNLSAPAKWTWADIINGMTGQTIPAEDGNVTVCSGNSVTVSGGTGVHDEEEITWDYSNFTRKKYVVDGLGVRTQYWNETVDVTSTTMTYTLEQWTNYFDDLLGAFVITGTITLTVTGTLSDEVTSASIYADIKTLLDEWDVSDDKQYPWRTDLKVSVAPLVARDEIANNGFADNYSVKDYATPITDENSHTLGDAGWIEDTGIVLAQDPSTGTTTISIGGFASNGDSFDAVAIGNPFADTLTHTYTKTGVLPPGVAFDSSTGALSGTCTADCTWGITVVVTGGAPQATGDIIGSPRAAGYQNSFDFYFQDIVGCCYRPIDNPGEAVWSWYQHGWGMDVNTFNSGSGCRLPLNATHWTNYWQAINKPEGAWIFFADKGSYSPGTCLTDLSQGGDATGLWACKYAEILEGWPSQNCARPAGADKFSFDETKVYCATNASGSGVGSTWTLINPVTGVAPPDDTDFGGTWGGQVVDGFYAVSGYSGGTLTLGAKAYNLPSDWASKSHGDEAMCFGKLRFPDCPALLGRVGITTMGPGTTFIFASPQTAFGQSAITGDEQVDLFDKDMTLLASNVTAHAPDDSHFTIASGQPTAKWVTITGQKYYWNDDSPKGDFALLKFLSDYRSFGVPGNADLLGEYNRLTGVLDCSGTQVSRPSTITYADSDFDGTSVTVDSPGNGYASFSQTPGCLPFSPCAPKVVCISPNGESFPNGITYDFPATFVMDERYGSKWWAWIQSAMTDLLWQPPHRPCNIQPCAKWIADDGTCPPHDTGGDCDAGDFPIYYYGHPPQVEAILSIPNNYGAGQNEDGPALPSGIQIGWLSPVDNSTGEIALPPLPPGALEDLGKPADAATQWALHKTLCDHATGCRFGYQLAGC